ncbi:MAG: glycosyltransferase family 32 protein [Terrisporobacter sp.]|mgnify:CR=1 FL=1|uniref:glycosyltransferase family 32 protein n=1 Tax=Terrisporobacter sp. TaxID=1965305 RepID=UPI003993FF67
MIPKVIHYCWFGHNEKPELVKRCIESWKKYCPDYEIKEWNEDNFDINICKFTEEAYNKKKWAFVSDFVRLYILYNYGGVYLDTDVELKESINEWMNNEGWLVFENENRINTGLGCASIKNNEIIKIMLEDYHDRSFLDINGNINMQVCTDINTEILIEKLPSLVINDRHQVINGMHFITTGEYNLKANHHASASWTDHPKTKVEIRKYKDTKLKRILRNYRIQYFIRNHFGKKIFKIYTFLVYDLIEEGLIYHISRQIKKRYIYRKEEL